jgi:hypothetical protein
MEYHRMGFMVIATWWRRSRLSILDGTNIHRSCKMMQGGGDLYAAAKSIPQYV